VQYGLKPYCTLQLALAVSGEATGSGVVGQGVLEAREIAPPRIVAVVPMKRRERPVLHVGNKGVLDRVEQTIIDMVRVVALVADQVLPVAPLMKRERNP
jgi:hypothetical protein